MCRMQQWSFGRNEFKEINNFKYRFTLKNFKAVRFDNYWNFAARHDYRITNLVVEVTEQKNCMFII